MNARLKLSQIVIYPIKSLAGISLTSAAVTARGLKHDRLLMLVDNENQFLSQRTHPKMALLQPNFTEKGIRIRHKNNAIQPFDINFNASELKKNRQVSVWEDEVQAVSVDEQADEQFSDYLGFPCSLVQMPESTHRKVDEQYAVTPHDVTSFADGYPILIIGENALADLNSRLSEPIAMDRFRPNLVFSGGDAFEEDNWYKFIVNEVVFYGVKPCARCVMTTINQQTGEKPTGEPLKTLAQYRNFNNKILFGQNVIPASLGIVNLGDEILVESLRV